jgi:DNA-binding FadR family transcriptional regulator
MRFLIEEIVDGVRKPGDLLPREADLAEQFDVSRGVARETIRAMEERGLISVKHGRGATVNDASLWNVFDSDVLAAMLASARSGEILGEYLECRRILEVEAAGMAAERGGEEDLKSLWEALEQMRESAEEVGSASPERRFHEADVAFHKAIIAATGNRALGGLVEPIHSALFIARFPLARPQYRLERALPEHRRIYEAVAAHDPQAARAAMSAHLDTIAGYLLEEVA